MGRKAFSDFLKIKNLREGKWQDGKLINVYFELVVGAFSFPNVSWHPSSNSIRLNCGRGCKVKGNYIKTILKLINVAVIEYRKQNAESN